MVCPKSCSKLYRIKSMIYFVKFAFSRANHYLYWISILVLISVKEAFKQLHQSFPFTLLCIVFYIRTVATFLPINFDQTDVTLWGCFA